MICLQIPFLNVGSDTFYSLQVYTGPNCSKNGVVQPGIDISALTRCHCRQFENCENRELEPLIARLEGTKQDNDEVVQGEGGYTKAWTVAKQLDSKNRRKKVDWKDIIPKSSIILSDFKLTPNNHLRKLTADYLKKTYLELKQSN